MGSPASKRTMVEAILMTTLIVNESNDPSTIGDLVRFDSYHDALSYYETWFVNEKYIAINSNKRKIFFCVDQSNNELTIVEDSDPNYYPDLWDAYCTHLGLR
jgi:hypothetical protein